jgi:predicted transcriptional regulator of viral defense system
MKTTSSKSHEQVALALAKTVPLLRARDLAAHGVPPVALTRLVAAGKLERHGRGLYSLPNGSISEHRSLAEVALRAPSGVICLLSALRVHGIGTQAPFEVWLALPNNILPPRMEHPAIRVVRMSGSALTEGIEVKTFDGVRVKVFGAAKTVSDCFKFRHKIGLDVALEALREGTRLRKFTNEDMARSAAINRVTQVMRPYLQGLSA